MFLDNKSKLIETGEKCLKDNMLAYAAKAFELANDGGRLSKLGDMFLKSGLIKSALKCYELAKNEMMVSFIKENFGDLSHIKPGGYM